MADIASIVDINALDVAQLERLRDACNRRLLDLRRTQGLTLPELLRLFEETKAALRDQHKEWRSLERWQWMDGEIRFWLNPADQENYRSGWFSIDDLIAWLHESGPIVIAPEVDEEDPEDEELWTSADGVKITWLPDERPRAESHLVTQ
ncbi:MAG TPA: hypothetical protein VNL77_05415 [Roseiflexaceae bacterium]|nr:hypothetical protein [Roseiflexaceae bacterium]